MNCGGCMYAPPTQVWPCVDCCDGDRKVLPKEKPLQKPSAWERRWIKWAEKERKKKGAKA